MHELGARLEQQGRELIAEARAWYKRSFDARSLDGLNALIRLTVADGDYAEAHWLMRAAASMCHDRPGESLVTVAPDVLGRTVSLDGDDVDDVVGAGDFTVVSPDPDRAAAAVARVADELMNVDERGVYITTEQWVGEGRDDEAYTPNYLFPTQVSEAGARVSLDTKGVMWSAMGRTMVGILADALAADRVPAHITGFRADLDRRWRDWAAPS
jgi:hypothetical protein